MHRHVGRSCSCCRCWCGRAIVCSPSRRFSVGATGNGDANDVARVVDHPAGAVTPVRAAGAEPLCCLGSATVTRCATGAKTIWVYKACMRLWVVADVLSRCNACSTTGGADKGRRCRGSGVSARVRRLRQARVYGAELWIKRVELTTVQRATGQTSDERKASLPRAMGVARSTES